MERTEPKHDRVVYTIIQIADELGYHPDTIRRKIRENRFPITKAGASIVVTKDVMTDLINGLYIL